MKLINIIAPIYHMGYGVVGLNVVKALAKSDYEVALFVIGQPNIPDEDVPLVTECMNNSQLPNFDAPCIRIWHQHNMSQFVGKGLHVGYPIFELDNFTKEERHHLLSLDKIFVCSKWAKEVILKSCMKQILLNTTLCDNIHVIPLGVDRGIFTETVSNRSETIFFNCGKWEFRKGHDFIVEAFNEAFEPSDDVELWMMCDNPFLSEEESSEWANLYKKSRLGDKIRLIPRQQSQKDVYNIMRQTDCGVFPSRAEGWNLELLEMMSCGKHVIATNYSAHTEFCNEENCRLIEIDKLESAYDGKWFFYQGQWGSLGDKQNESLVKNFREIHELKKTGNLGVNISGIETATKFSWENTANKVIGSLYDG